MGKKSVTKGKTAEREICKILNERFASRLDAGQFSRSLGSGNRWSQASLTTSANEVFAGDVVVPPDFKFCIESKAIKSFDLVSALSAGNRQLDAFLSQVETDTFRCGREALLILKANHRPRLAFIRTFHQSQLPIFNSYFVYHGWLCVPLDDLLKLDDSFFFSERGNDAEQPSETIEQVAF